MTATPATLIDRSCHAEASCPPDAISPRGAETYKNTTRLGSQGILTLFDRPSGEDFFPPTLVPAGRQAPEQIRFV
jgi:hypothetical protein